MSIKNREITIDTIKKYDINICSEKIPNFFSYNNLLSSYSGIIIEYLLVLKKEPIIILEKKKVRNVKYKNTSTFEDLIINKIESKYNSLIDLCDKKK